MTPERWLLVKQLFHVAVSRAADDRSAFLAAACDGDAWLRAEIERLLTAHEQAGSFIEHSPVSGGAGAGGLRPSSSGLVIGHYEIGRLIGVGGMGEVYAARDLELGRDVAIKLGIATDPQAHARLKREAQHASRLNHPHICTIHEVGRHDDQPFIVMELVDGRQLSELVPSGGMPAEEVVRFGGQIADALAHAHANGVLHRDLKSANVIITPDGRSKVLDFGLAREVSRETLKEATQSRESLTAEGLVAGTLAVMAPELLRGERGDERSDIWALGVLLYEMSCGEKPFRGTTGFELSAAILHQPPSPLPERVPVTIAGVVKRCLEKNPHDRFQSADDVRAALTSATSDRTGSRFRAPIRVSKLKLALTLAAIALVLMSYYFVSGRIATAPRAVGTSGRPAIAVMHFGTAGVLDPDSSWLSSGVPSMLATGLAQTQGLEIVSERRLQEALRQTSATTLDTLDRAQAADVARRAGAGAIVVGTVFRAGSDVRIDAQIEDLASGRVLGARSVRGADVFALVDQLAAGIRDVVGFGNAGNVRRLADISSTSLEAYHLYSDGMRAAANARWLDADRLYKAAVAIDPSFAEAYRRLAAVSGAMGLHTARSEYLSLALRHADRLSERDRLQLRIQAALDRDDRPTAIRVLDELIEKFPDVEDAYAFALILHGKTFAGPKATSKALALTAAGVAMLPSSTLTRNVYGYALLNAGRYAEAIAQFEEYARLAPREPNPSDSLAEAHLKMGDAEKAVEGFTRALTIDPNFQGPHNLRAWSLAVLGRYDEALAEPVALAHFKAMILSRVGRYREAGQALAAGEKEAKGSGDRAYEGGLRLVAALLAIERKDRARALRDLQTAAAIFAEQPDLIRQGRVVTALLAGLAHLQAGRLPEALSLSDQQERDYNSASPVDSIWRQSLLAELALSRGELDRAAAAFTAAEPPWRILDTSFFPLFSVMINDLPSRDGLARVAVARGDVDAAIRIYRGLLVYGAHSKWLAPKEPLYVLQIARLLEKKGDRGGALQEYRQFLQLWKHADAELPELAEARQAVRRLD